MRSYKHLAPCPCCGLHQPQCQGHEPERWALQQFYEFMVRHRTNDSVGYRTYKPRKRRIRNGINLNYGGKGAAA
jgi:hypothetical protein